MLKKTIIYQFQLMLKIDIFELNKEIQRIVAREEELRKEIDKIIAEIEIK